MSEKKDQLKEILKNQLNKEAKQIEEEVGLNDNEEIPNELKIRMKMHWIKKSVSVKCVLKI